MLSMIGLLGGLILLIILTLRGVNLFIAAPAAGGRGESRLLRP